MPINWRAMTREEWDTARRAADQLNVHLLAHGSEAHGKFVAIRLSDGGSDGVLYETRYDAVRHQLHASQCVYARVTVGGASPKAMWVLMVYMRQIYDAGGRFETEAPRLPLLGEHLGMVSPRLGRAVQAGK
jgi:hypothetical protein